MTRAKIYYNKLLVGCLDGSYMYADVPDRYKLQVRKLANDDLKIGVLPKWQYDLMKFPVEEV